MFLLVSFYYVVFTLSECSVSLIFLIFMCIINQLGETDIKKYETTLNFDLIF